MIKTPWGYTLTELNELPTILTEEEFSTMTAGRYTDDVRIPSMLAAAQSAVRELCGWHIADNQPCEVTLYSDSQYLVKAFNDHWIDGWIKKGWKRSGNEPVKNVSRHSFCELLPQSILLFLQ